MEANDEISRMKMLMEELLEALTKHCEYIEEQKRILAEQGTPYIPAKCN